MLIKINHYTILFTEEIHLGCEHHTVNNGIIYKAQVQISEPSKVQPTRCEVGEHAGP